MCLPATPQCHKGTAESVGFEEGNRGVLSRRPHFLSDPQAKTMTCFFSPSLGRDGCRSSRLWVTYFGFIAYILGILQPVPPGDHGKRGQREAQRIRCSVMGFLEGRVRGLGWSSEHHSSLWLLAIYVLKTHRTSGTYARPHSVGQTYIKRV